VLAAAGTGIGLAAGGAGHGAAGPQTGASASLGRTAAPASPAGSPSAAPVKTPPAAPVTTAPAAVAVEGRWSGTYVCNQGRTGVQLTITGSGDDAVKAVVDFYPVASNPGVANGSYEMVGSYSAAGGLVLNPDYWISEPPGYEMVGLTAPPPRGGAMSGSVQGDNCSTFSVTRG
jgi:hypothetical protein